MDLSKLSREELEHKLEIAHAKISEYELIYQDHTEKSIKISESEKSFRDIFNNAIDAIYVLDKQGYFIDVNQGAEELYGYDKSELIGKTPALTGAPGMNNMKEVIQLITKAYHGEPQQFEFWGQRKNGEIFPKLVRLSTGYYFGQKSIFAFAIDMTEQKKAEKLKSTLYKISSAVSSTINLQELYKDIQSFLHDIIDTTNFYVALYDKNKQLITFDYYADSIHNIGNIVPTTRDFGKGLTEYVITKNKPYFLTKEMQHELYEKGEIELIGARSEIWFGVPLRMNCEVTGVIAVQSYSDPQKFSPEDLDILSFISVEIAHAIQKKRSEERIKMELDSKNTLLKELYHRTKNNMQVISSMLRMQIRSLDSRNVLDSQNTEIVQNIFNDVVHKINSMSLVHQKLYQNQDLTQINLKEYVQDLSNLMIQGCNKKPGAVKFCFQLENMMTKIEIAIPLGLVVTELVSNCLKYAFPKDRKGSIFIELFKSEDECINIRVQDDGIGVSPDFEARELATMGLQTVYALVEYQLHGKITWENNNGLCWIIKLGLKDILN